MAKSVVGLVKVFCILLSPAVRLILESHRLSNLEPVAWAGLMLSIRYES